MIGDRRADTQSVRCCPIQQGALRSLECREERDGHISNLHTRRIVPGGGRPVQAGEGGAWNFCRRGETPYLKHEPDEDADDEEEADVRMVVDDELLAEDGVSFPPSESHLRRAERSPSLSAPPLHRAWPRPSSPGHTRLPRGGHAHLTRCCPPRSDSQSRAESNH